MAITQREREAVRRADKLAAIAEQVAEGRLSIRQMTAAERARFGTDDLPPRPPRRPRWHG